MAAVDKPCGRIVGVPERLWRKSAIDLELERGQDTPEEPEGGTLDPDTKGWGWMGPQLHTAAFRILSTLEPIKSALLPKTDVTGSDQLRPLCDRTGCRVAIRWSGGVACLACLAKASSVTP